MPSGGFSRPAHSRTVRWLASGPWLAVAVLLLGRNPLPGQAPHGASDDWAQRFQRQVLPLLADRCFACHGPDQAANQSGLRLDQRAAALAPLPSGEGRAIVPGDPEQSVLLQRVAASELERMPPAEAHQTPLTAAEQTLLRDWVTAGAIYTTHWSFQPLPAEIPVPNAGDGWARSPIDRFVAAALRQREQTPARESERWRWLRRVALDLTGLPATPQEIQDFLGDERPDAYERVVDRLLASPRFGQHQATRWLDLARYADSFGYQSDLLCNVHPYRDWVIDALNKNLPYDQFLTWQLAGDLLPQPTRESQIATTFNRLHRQTNEGGSIDREWRLEYAADRVKTFGTAMLGLTLECARCHDHKYDPISTADFYSLTAFFNSIDEYGTYNDSQHVPTPTMLLPTPQQQAAIESAQSEREDATLQWTIYEESIPARYNEWTLRGGQPLPRAPVSQFTLDVRQESGQFPNLAPELAADVVARWSSVPAAPESAAGDPLTAFPPLSLLANCPLPNRTVAGQRGSAVELTGDHPLSLPAMALTPSQPFTIACWLWLPPDIRGEERIIWHQTSGTDTGFSGTELKLVDGGLQLSMQRFWPGNALAIASERPVPTEQWVAVVATYDGLGSAAGMRIYIDGEAKNRIVRNDLTKSPNSGDRITFGERFRTRGPAGARIDQIEVYDSAWAAAEATAFSAGRDIVASWPHVSDDARQAFFASRIDPLAEQIRRTRRQAVDQLFAAQDPVLELMVMRELPRPRETFIKPRGQYDAAETDALRVTRGVPAALPPLHGATSPPNRLDLARWLTQPDHPLTARVVVNRAWQNFFGRGLVETAEDWGVQGTPPSHPDLLAWLARDFVDHGWDYKRLCRQIALSATYRQTSACDPASREQDPQNQWLARGPAHRLTAEMLRDLALFAGGLLDDRLGGPPASPYQPDGLWTENNAFSPGYQPSVGTDRYRRSIYSIWKRTAPLPNMMALDAVDRETCVARRTPTNTPLAALVLLNDPQFVEAANHLAALIVAVAGLSDQQRIDQAFLSLVGRPATEREQAIALAALAEQRAGFAQRPADAEALLPSGAGIPAPPEGVTKPELAAWALLVQTILNSDGCVWSR